MHSNKSSWLSNSLKAKKNIWTINHTENFLKCLAIGILEECDFRNDKLAEVTILLPTKRAAKLIQDIFLENLQTSAILLPNIIPFQEIGEEELINPRKTKPSIPKISRRFLLTRLILKQMETSQSIPKLEIANNLAKELEYFVDDIQTHSIKLDSIDKIVPENLASHWQNTLEFLNIIRFNWPKILDEQNLSDPIERRNKLFEQLSLKWSTKAPKGLIIAAGTTATIPATRELMKVIKNLPNGVLVLPGLDINLEERAWNCIDETHPQFSLKEFLKYINHDRCDINSWPYKEKTKSKMIREQFISETMRPKETTELWLQIKKQQQNISNGISIIQAENNQNEAINVAVAMRHIEQKKNLSCALITHDKQLAKNVSYLLKNWDINIENSYGVSLSETKQGIFLQLVAEVSLNNFSSISLLSLLKHQLLGCGIEKIELIKNIHEIEINHIRGKRYLTGINELYERISSDLNSSKEIINWLKYFKNTISDFSLLKLNKKVPFSKLLRAHINCCEKLAKTPDANGLQKMWTGEDGESCSNFLKMLINNSEGMGDINCSSYQKFFSELLNEESFVGNNTSHSKLKILSPIEARLTYHDIVILGGLNEGVWPEELKTGPWLNLEMRNSLGLPKLDNKIGQSASDLCHGLGAKEVLLTRSIKENRNPSIASRWWYRIENIINISNDSKKENIIDPRNIQNWSKNLFIPDKKISCSPPEPNIPERNKPRSFSITNAGILLRNPYEFYVKNILKLVPLERIEPEDEKTTYGIILHKILEVFLTHSFAINNSYEQNYNNFLNTSEKIITQYAISKVQKKLWFTRIKSIGEKFINHITSDSIKIDKYLIEIKGQYKFETKVGSFSIIGKADRIDLFNKNEIRIIDYKTGKVPDKWKINNGFEPQMILLALIASHDGFERIPSIYRNIKSLEYWQVHGREVGITITKLKIDEIKNKFLAFENFIEDFHFQNKTYFYQIDKTLSSPFDISKNLAREEEWIHKIQMESNQ